MKANSEEVGDKKEETTQKDMKPFFYYPRHKKGNKSRKIVAGCIVEGKLYLGVSQVFSGHKKRPSKDGKDWEMPTGPDQFNKKMGRGIAVGRALRGCVGCHEKGLRYVIDIPEETLKGGTLGKFFVAEVEKRFKPMVRKPKPGNEKTIDSAHPEATN